MNLLYISLLFVKSFSIREIKSHDTKTSDIIESQVPISSNDLIPRQDILNHALASAEMALQHDKENWISLFDENAVLDDPTGSYEFKGHEGLSLFWDGLMEPTVSINFTNVLQPDIVANYSKCYINDCHAVVGRSVEITTTFPLEGVVVKLSPTILYTIVSKEGQLSILDEHTYWILEDQVKQLLSLGTVGIRTMASVGINMIRSFGLPITIEYFFNGLFGGVSQEFGKITMENLCNSITTGNKELFKEILGNNGSFVASLSFPIGHIYTDIDSAWQAVMGIGIEMNGYINSSGLFTAVPVYLLLPFNHQIRGNDIERNQYASTMIRLEFEEATENQQIMPSQISKADSSYSKQFPMKHSHLLKSVEFYFDF